MREQIQIAHLARKPEGTPEHGTIHEHVLSAVVWIRVRGRALIRAWAITPLLH